MRSRHALLLLATAACGEDPQPAPRQDPRSLAELVSEARRAEGSQADARDLEGPIALHLVTMTGAEQHVDVSLLLAGEDDVLRVDLGRFVTDTPRPFGVVTEATADLPSGSPPWIWSEPVLRAIAVDAHGYAVRRHGDTLFVDHVEDRSWSPWLQVPLPPHARLTLPDAPSLDDRPGTIVVAVSELVIPIGDGKASTHASLRIGARVGPLAEREVHLAQDHGWRDGKALDPHAAPPGEVLLVRDYDPPDQRVLTRDVDELVMWRFSADATWVAEVRVPLAHDVAIDLRAP